MSDSHKSGIRPTRRAALALLGGTAACAPVVETFTHSPVPDTRRGLAFEHGVASGDPDTTSVVLWTCVPSDIPGQQPVEWEIADNPDFEGARGGRLSVGPERSYCAKVIRTPSHYMYPKRNPARAAGLGRGER